MRRQIAKRRSNGTSQHAETSITSTSPSKFRPATIGLSEILWTEVSAIGANAVDRADGALLTPASGNCGHGEFFPTIVYGLKR